jgi:hypothetical protein
MFSTTRVGQSGWIQALGISAIVLCAVKMWASRRRHESHVPLEQTMSCCSQNYFIIPYISLVIHILCRGLFVSLFLFYTTSNHDKEESMLQGSLCNNSTGWIVLHHFIQEIDTHGSQSGYKGSQAHLAEMSRTENLACSSNGWFSCRICTGHGIVHSTICKFGSLWFCLMSIFIVLSLLSSSFRSFPLNLSSSGIS